MKHTFKLLILGLAFSLAGHTFGQKFDKTFTDSFNVQKDVEVEINAAHCDINVTTWNKNQVQVKAYIEIEGLSKDEAEKYFKNWDFEALGNTSKVRISAQGNNKFHLKNDFVFFTDQNFVMPDIDVENFDAVVLPNMDFNFDFDFKDVKIMESLESLENLGDFDIWVEKDGEFNITWKDGDKKIVIKSKKDFEDFKKTKAYKELQSKMKLEREKMRKDLAKSKEEILKKIEENRIKVKIDREKIKRSLENAKRELEKLKFSYSTDQNNLTINGKKVKITKKIEIKAPRKATFDLNTRHCKVKLPKTVASGSVRYGKFNANTLAGGELKIYYSPVTIEDLNSSNLYLNNVTDATIASVTNTKLQNSSSKVKITKINQNVAIKHKFGNLFIDAVASDFGAFNLYLDYADAEVTLPSMKEILKYDIVEKSPWYPNKASMKIVLGNNKTQEVNGNFIIANGNKGFTIKGKHSQLLIKK